MDNYATMLDAARQHFLEYDIGLLTARNGVTDRSEYLHTRFFAEEVLIHKRTGHITVSGREAAFAEGLSIYDWLCDRKADAVAAEEFCTVNSLPGVLVSGSGLMMRAPRLAVMIDAAPETFQKCCVALEGTAVPFGDLGFRLPVFPDLPMVLKFYFGDGEFAPTMTFLWDRNILRFIRYETVYYIAGCLERRLRQMMSGEIA